MADSGCAAQLDGGPPSLAPPDGVTAAAIGDALRGIRMAGQGNDQERRQARRRVVEMSQPEVHAALTARVTTERPFVERLVAFWSNHLCVSTGAKILVAPLAGSYEREVIRPHVLGPLRGHGARVGEASGDARLSRQLPVDRADLARRARGSAAATTVSGAD